MNCDVVLVDDDGLTRELVVRRLKRTALRVQCFDSGESALQYFHEHATHVLLLDYRMPRQSGLEFLRELARMRHSPVDRTFLCSAAPPPAEAIAEARSLGASILPKSVYRDADQLVEICSAPAIVPSSGSASH